MYSNAGPTILKDWKPTPWFPVPWNREQTQAFDNLPSLGFIHRPVFVKFEDEHGKPVTRRDAPEAAGSRLAGGTANPAGRRARERPGQDCRGLRQ